MNKPQQCPICLGQNISKKFDVKDFFFTQEKFSLWQCKTCSVLFTHPQPPLESLAKYYDTPDYLSHNTKQNGVVGHIYRLLRDFNIHRKYKIVTKYIPQGRLLDIGCGSGELLYYFKRHNWSCTGIEPNPSAREFARSQYGLRIEKEEQLKKLPEKSFDVISMWHVLEHVPDVNERMIQVNRLLKDHGLLVIALPNPLSWDASYYQESWAAYDVPRHLYHFSRKAFKYLAKKHHFKITDILPLTLDAYYVSFLSERYKANRMPFVRASLKGMISNIKAGKTGNYSSLIYILRKN